MPLVSTYGEIHASSDFWVNGYSPRFLWWCKPAGGEGRSPTAKFVSLFNTYLEIFQILRFCRIIFLGHFIPAELYNFSLLYLSRLLLLAGHGHFFKVNSKKMTSKINRKWLSRSTAASILLGCLAFTFYPSPHDMALADTEELILEINQASRIRSVRQMIEQVRGLLNRPDWCDTKGCIAPLAIQVCSSIEVLNARVNGRILQRNIRSRNPLPITASQLQLFRTIWQHCRRAPANEIFIGSEGTVTIYSPPRCRDANRVYAALQLPLEDCSYER